MEEWHLVRNKRRIWRNICRYISRSYWNIEEFELLKGTPWEPEPGRPGIEIGTRVRIPVETNTELEEPEAAPAREFISRRTRLYKRDVRKYGMTPGCQGCIAVNTDKKTMQENH